MVHVSLCKQSIYHYLIAILNIKKSLRAKGEAISQHVRKRRDCRVATLLAMTDIYPFIVMHGFL